MARAGSEAIGGPVGRHAAPHPWWTPVRVVLAVACVAWMLAMVQKAPCAADGWTGAETRYAQLCYSDVPYLYVTRGLAEREVPYSDNGGRWPAFEQPVVVGYLAYVAAVTDQALHGWPDVADRRAGATDSVARQGGVDAERQDFFWVTAVMLAGFVLLAVFFLAGAQPGRPWDAMGLAAAPVLVLVGLVNWEVVALACVAGAFWALARDRPWLAGVLVGIGVATKVYPVLVLVGLLALALRRRRLGAAGPACAAAVLTWLVLNVPVLLLAREGWWGFWRFERARGADLGSVWFLAEQHGAAWGQASLNRWALGLFVVLVIAVVVVVLTARREPRLAQVVLLLVLAATLTGKAYPPQQVLWLLPLAVLARPRWRDLLLWQAGEAFYFVMVWLHLGGYTASSVTGGADPAYSLAIVVRVAAELYLAAVVLRDIARPWHDPVRQSREEPVQSRTT